MKIKLFTFLLIALLVAPALSHAGFMGFLRQNTAAYISLGPFVDQTDGKTLETALTIGQVDVRIIKHNSTPVQKYRADNALYFESGYYFLNLGKFDTNTLGTLRIVVNVNGSLLIEQSYQVINAATYASWH